MSLMDRVKKIRAPVKIQPIKNKAGVEVKKPEVRLPEDVVNIDIVVPIKKIITKTIPAPVTQYISAVSYIQKVLVFNYITRYVTKPETKIITSPVTVFNTVTVSRIVTYVATRIVTSVAEEEKEKEPKVPEPVPEKIAEKPMPRKEILVK